MNEAKLKSRRKTDFVRSTMENNPTELSAGDPHAVRLNSRANLENWKHRLSQAEIARVLEATHDIAVFFYGGTTHSITQVRRRCRLPAANPGCE